MTKDDIIRMARKAGLRRYQANLMSNPPQIRFFYESDEESIKRFAALVASEEREACARLCEELELPDWPNKIRQPLASAIRARGQHD